MRKKFLKINIQGGCKSRYAVIKKEKKRRLCTAFIKKTNEYCLNKQ